MDTTKMAAAFVNVILGIIAVYYFGYTFCRYGISGPDKYLHFDLRRHWQIWITGLVGWLIAAIIINLVFPYSQLYLQISSAAGLGCLPGVIIGISWYVISKRSILKVRFKGIVGLVLGTVVGLGLVILGTIPLLQKQQKELGAITSFNKNENIMSKQKEDDSSFKTIK